MATELRAAATLATALAFGLAACADQPTAPDVEGPNYQQSSVGSISPILNAFAKPSILVPGRYIVGFKDNLRDDLRTTTDNLAAQLGFSPHLYYENPPRGFAASLSVEQVEALQRRVEVAWIEYVVVGRPSTTQPNPLTGASTALINVRSH